MQPVQCGSQHQLAKPHPSTHRTTPEHQMTKVMQPFQCDLQAQIPKHPITTPTHKHTQSSLKPPLQCGKKKRQTDPSRNRRTDEVPFIAGCSHFTRKSTRFRSPASSPKHSPCNIMQPFQCDLQPQILKHPITTHTQAHPTQLQATVTMRQKKKGKPTPAATAAQTRYLSSPAAATLHGKTQGFVLRLPPQNIPHATSCSHSNAICHSLPLPFVTTSLPHHFPSSPLPFLTTSHRHHFPSSPLPFVTTPLHHHFPSSPLPFVTTCLPHHFPSSPLPFLTTPIVTTSLRHHFPSSPPVINCFLFFCHVLVHYVLLYYVLFYDLPPFLKVNFIDSYSFVVYWYIMYCYMIYHPSSRSISLLLILLGCIGTLCIVT